MEREDRIYGIWKEEEIMQAFRGGIELDYLKLGVGVPLHKALRILPGHVVWCKGDLHLLRSNLRLPRVGGVATSSQQWTHPPR